MEVDSHAGLHVHGAAAPHDGILARAFHVVRDVIRDGNRVDVAGEYDAGGQPPVRAGTHRVAVAFYLNGSLQRTQSFFHSIRDRLLVVRGAGNIHQRGSEFDGVSMQI